LLSRINGCITFAHRQTILANKLKQNPTGNLLPWLYDNLSTTISLGDYSCDSKIKVTSRASVRRIQSCANCENPEIASYESVQTFILLMLTLFIFVNHSRRLER